MNRKRFYAESNLIYQMGEWTSQALTDTFLVVVRTGGGPMGNRHRSQGIRVKYVFIKAHRREFDTAVMCRLFDVSRSGFYELTCPL